MRSIIVYKSIHHGNTRKVAEAIGEVLGSQLRESEEVTIDELLQSDLLGFGSGIYFFKPHETLLRIAERLPEIEKCAFIFSTAGFPSERWHKPLRKILEKKGFRIIGEFCCRGYTTHAPFNLFGGVNRGKPDEEDLRDARKFGEKIKEDFRRFCD